MLINFYLLLNNKLYKISIDFSLVLREVLYPATSPWLYKRLHKKFYFQIYLLTNTPLTLIQYLGASIAV